MKKPSIAIITRMAFSDKLTVNQLQRFEEYLTCLNSQTYTDFKVYLIVDKVRDFVGSEMNKVFISGLAEKVLQVHLRDPERFKHDIEVRLDYDDLVSPDFVQDLVDNYNTWNLDNFIISYQPIVYDVKTGDKYHHPSTYSTDCPSMCMALVQKGEKKYGVYDRPHNLMQQETGFQVVVEDEGFYYLQVHGQNTLSKLPKKENLIK